MQPTTLPGVTALLDYVDQFNAGAFTEGPFSWLQNISTVLRHGERNAAGSGRNDGASVVDATRVEIQRDMAERNEAVPQDKRRYGSSRPAICGAEYSIATSAFFSRPVRYPAPTQEWPEKCARGTVCPRAHLRRVIRNSIARKGVVDSTPRSPTMDLHMPR